MSDKRILRIDASLLRESGCSLRLFYYLLMHYNEQCVNIDVQFGSAFHHFASTMVKSDGNFALAIKGAKEILARTPVNIKKGKEYLADNRYLQKVCYDWWDWHVEKDNLLITRVDDEPFVEKNFALKVYEDDELIIELCGTMDFLGEIRNGWAAICDYKTTAVKDEEYYFRPYQLSTQLRTYRYAVKRYASLYPDSIWAKLQARMGGCFIYGVFHEPPSSGKDVRFIRSPLIQFKDWEMEEYEILLKQKVEQVRSLYYNFVKQGIVPLREGVINGCCKTEWGECKFASICAEPDAVIRKHIIAKNYTTRTYDPLTFGK